jgi:hypothetical protein
MWFYVESRLERRIIEELKYGEIEEKRERESKGGV